jgi:CRISPR/Cas system CSM-associated protein Csm3 (group 7 of RAMP superfamily)
MNYFEFGGNLKLLEPFTVNVANMNGLPKDTMGNPMIPASTLRGWLRFASYRCLVHLYKEHGKLFSIHEHYMLAKGVDTGGLIEKERGTTVGANVRVREVNPMMDLYGRWGLSSALGVSNAIASKSNIIKLGASSRSHIQDNFDNFDDYIIEGEKELLNQIVAEDADFSPEIRELKNKAKAIYLEKRSSSGAVQDDLQEQLNDINKQIDSVKSKKIGSRESIRRLSYGVEALDRGSVIPFKMKLNGNHIESYKFLIWTMSKLNLFSLGGMQSHNFGRVECILSVINRSFKNPLGTHIGEVHVEEYDFHYHTLDPMLFDLEEFENSLLDESKFNFRMFGG